MRWSKLLIGELLLFEKGHEVQQIENIGRQRIGRVPTGTQLTHKAGHNGNRLIVLIEEFKRDVILVTQLDTVYSHGSLAPSVQTHALSMDMCPTRLQMSTSPPGR